MSECLKNKFNWRNKICVYYLNKNNKDVEYITFQNAITEVPELICKSKDYYYDQLVTILTDPKTNCKIHWFQLINMPTPKLKTFYNGKKVPLIPPLLINDKPESDVLRKTYHFNNFFASKCTPLKNDSVLPIFLNVTQKLDSLNLILQMIKYWIFLGLLSFWQGS